jgi:hypothetical protein
MKLRTMNVLISGLVGSLFIYQACSPRSLGVNDGSDAPTAFQQRALDLFEISSSDSLRADFIQTSLQTVPINFPLPALQSPVAAMYDGKWILFGGRKSGLHTMNNDPPAFSNRQVNDSIWVIDPVNQISQGVLLPARYFRYLTASSQQYFQDGETLYVMGGFTFSDSTSNVSNWTSDFFHEINLPNLIEYVTTQGQSPSLDQVITKEIEDPFLQLTGGEMFLNNGNFYLVGGQNYIGAYIPGNNGIYSSSVRKFRISQSGSDWVLSDTLTLRDTVNLHRRDYNLAEVIVSSPDSLAAVVYGGVFTKNGLGYRSPIYLSGLASGVPRVTVDRQALQKVNLYSSAKVQSIMAFGDYRINRISLLGGITYMAYDPDSNAIVVPEFINALPFSNLISSYYTDGEDQTIELVQLPPNELMPGYLGSNAIFFPLPELLYGNSISIIDLDKVFPDPVIGPVLVGYFYGGIESPVPNTSTPGGNYTTKTNSKLYGVYFSLGL